MNDPTAIEQESPLRDGYVPASVEYRSVEDFDDAEHGDEVVIRDAAHRLWLAYSDEAGNWWAVCPRDEDDGPDESSRWTPIGPVPLEGLVLPWLVWQPGYGLPEDAR